MARLIVGNRVYEGLSLHGMSEAELESAIQGRTDLAYPGYHLVPFKRLLQTPGGPRRPDFLLVEERLRAWWVCEAELLSHSLSRHVLPQVQDLLEADYDRGVADAICVKAPYLPKDGVRRLVDTEPPRVLVVADRQSDQWRSAIEDIGAQFGVFEVLRSNMGEYVFRVNGYVPAPWGRKVGVVRFNPAMPTLGQVTPATAFPPVMGAQVVVVLDGSAARFRVMVQPDRCYLVAETPHTFASGVQYELSMGEDGIVYAQEKNQR